MVRGLISKSVLMTASIALITAGINTFKEDKVLGLSTIIVGIILLVLYTHLVENQALNRVLRILQSKD